MCGVLKDSLGHSHRLTSRFSIGRSQDNDLVLDDPRVSRHHALLVGENGRWFFCDLGSHNGSRLNGAPAGRKAPLRDGDRLELGDRVLVFHAKPGGAAPDPAGDTVFVRRSSPIPVLRRRFGVTPREAEVLCWVAEGKSNPEIGVILDTTVSTVRKHLEHIFVKLGVENRRCAMRQVWELLGTEPPAIAGWPAQDQAEAA